jgi:hypothetical protein
LTEGTKLWFFSQGNSSIRSNSEHCCFFSDFKEPAGRDKKARTALSLGDDAIILDRGRVVHRGSSAALMSDAALLEGHLGARETAAPTGR